MVDSNFLPSLHNVLPFWKCAMYRKHLHYYVTCTGACDLAICESVKKYIRKNIFLRHEFIALVSWSGLFGRLCNGPVEHWDYPIASDRIERHHFHSSLSLTSHHQSVTCDVIDASFSFSEFLAIVNSGFCSRNIRFPAKVLARWLFLESPDEANDFCIQRGLDVSPAGILFKRRGLEMKHKPVSAYYFLNSSW